MRKYAGVLIATIVVVALSGLLFTNEMTSFAAAVLLIGICGVALLARNVQELDEGPTEQDEAPAPKSKVKVKPIKKKTSRAKLEEAIEQSTSSTASAPQAFRPATPAAPPAESLPTWNAATLDTWTAPAAEPQPEAAPVAEEPSWAAWDEGPDRGPLADEFDDDNPLSALDRLDEIDPIAEVERLEGMGAEAPAADSGFSFSSAPKVIREEEVQTADDIMAASEATELHVASDENSELAKLLAKVQARLAAYE